MTTFASYISRNFSNENAIGCYLLATDQVPTNIFCRYLQIATNFSHLVMNFLITNSFFFFFGSGILLELTFLMKHDLASDKDFLIFAWGQRYRLPTVWERRKKHDLAIQITKAKFFELKNNSVEKKKYN